MREGAILESQDQTLTFTYHNAEHVGLWLGRGDVNRRWYGAKIMREYFHPHLQLTCMWGGQIRMKSESVNYWPHGLRCATQ
jgi:hypothetical protein